MMNALRIGGWLLGLIPAMLSAQSAVPSTAQQQQSFQVLDPYQGGWSVTDAGTALDSRSFNEVAPSTITGLDAFRNERNVALVQGKGRLSTATRERLSAMRDELAEEDPDGFDVHLASYYLAFPARDAFVHLDQAAQRDRSRVELIGPQLAYAAQRGDQAAIAVWSKELRTRGRVAPGLWQVAEDLLASVDRDCILITAGEMDAYPTWALQAAANKRRDVLIVDERLLEDPTYRGRIWVAAGCKGNVPGNSQTFIPGLSAASTRPVFLSMALGDRINAAWRPQLYVTGIAFRFSQAPYDNIKDLEVRWANMNKPTDAGTLSQNYLVPAAVLLKHYRSVNDEAGMARMERSLRGLAAELNASDRLYRSGLLQH